ncbi:Ubiquitin carboxyl-terminal hydrolase 19 [Blomia tropicalis]|nr:Ubiquitin carboxyl-terminal hydrolase 19 [Blomia tropicalis]
MNKLGSGGDIVQEFAKFLQQLWTGKHLSISPARIKSLVGEKITSMFMGYNQHDAQEFMSYFLDSIHEDLNQNNNRPKIDYSKKENDKNEEDDLFSDEDFINKTKRKHMESLLKSKSEDMWEQYKLFNSSIVIDLFCGQFKSILRCHDCTKKSIMFDPFLYVPLPIPPSKTTYEVTFFSRDSSTGMCTNSTIYSVALSYRATVGDLVNIVSNRANISPKLVRIIQPLDNHLFPKYPNPNWLLADYGTTAKESNNNRQLLLFEVFDDEQEDYVEIYIMQRSLSLLSIGQSINSRIGLPFIISLKRSMLTYSHLCLVLCSYASHSISANQVVSIDGVHNNIYSGDLQNNNNNNNNNNNHEHDPSFIEPSHKMLRFNTDMFSPINIPSLIDGFKDRFDGLSSAPHLIYHKSTSAKAQDILVPFILRKPNLNEQCVSSIEEEIVPPLIPELDTSDIDSEESYSTLVNSSNGEENDNEEISDNVKVISQEDSSNKSPPEMAKSELPIMAPIEEQMERLPQASLEFDNDAVLDIGTTYSLAIDWIDVSNFSRTMVKLSTKTVRSSVIDLTRNGEADISLDDCFQLRCPSCKELREATKQLSFWRLPPILVIQLKRFKMRGIIYRDKITKLVSYPIDGLDLSKYTYNCVETDHGRVKPIYDLYAVVNHVGGPFLGHFTSFARSFNGDLGWREFDDTSVEKIEKSSVVTDHAYLLFYKLRDWSG